MKTRKMPWREQDRVLATIFGLGLLAAPLPAIGAPYCVRTLALPPQCLYFDPAACNTRAIQMGGRCTANAAEVQLRTGLGHYCLITPGNVSECIFADLAVCNAEAQHQQGVCVDAPNAPESPAPDPFRDIRPLGVGG